MLALCWLLLCLFFFLHCSSSSSSSSNNKKNNSPATAGASEEVLIAWSNLTVTLRNPGHERVILSMKYNGAVYQGRLLGILGPSGSGKTTFLSLLSGKLMPSHYGSLSGVGVTSDLTTACDLFRTGSLVAFVHQDDSFFSMLSVHEALTLTAALRLPNENKEARRLAVNEVLKSLALSPVANTRVGDSLGTRGISGGERKRLSVACELLARPLLLIADEPTSGLDSHQALNVVEHLKHIVKTQNLAGVCTLHQPRSSIWSLLDDVILLGPRGLPVYHGKREDAIAYFASLGFRCPAQTNPSEFLIDLVSIDHTSVANRDASWERIKKIENAFQENAKGRTSFISKAQKRRNKQHGEDLLKRDSISKKKAFGRAAPRAIRAVAKSVERFALLLQRALRQTARDGGTNLVRFGVSGVLAMILSSAYGKMNSGPIEEGSVGDRVTIIAQAAIQVAMLAMIKTLQLFKKERVVVGREMATSQYSSLEYLLSKSLAELPVDALVSGFFGLVLHSRANLSCERKVFVGILALLGCACSSLGLAVSALSPSADVALAFGPALMVVYVIMGAIGPNKQNKNKELPMVLKSLRNASPILPACSALCVAELDKQRFRQASKNFLSPLKNVFRIVTSIATIRFKVAGGKDSSSGDDFGRKADGNRALESIGLGTSSVKKESKKLVVLLVVHSSLALLGLWFSSR